MIDNRTAYLTKHRAINRWAQYMHSFGLGRPLGVDIPDEVGGCIPDSAYLRRRHGNWDGTTIMWVGMGQGEVTTTPLQLCNLAAMIHHGGRRQAIYGAPPRAGLTRSTSHGDPRHESSSDRRYGGKHQHAAL